MKRCILILITIVSGNLLLLSQTVITRDTIIEYLDRALEYCFQGMDLSDVNFITLRSPDFVTTIKIVKKL